MPQQKLDFDRSIEVQRSDGFPSRPSGQRQPPSQRAFQPPRQAVSDMPASDQE